MWTPLPFESNGPDGYYREDRGLHVHLLGTNHPHEWHGHRLRHTGRIDTPVGWVHHDYYYAALQVYDWIFERDEYEVVVSGHSYGGAVAEIVVALRIMDGVDARVVTYGGVKPGDIRVYYPTTHYRHRGDVAPWWPLWPWYKRTGEVTRVGKWKVPWKAHKIASYRETLGVDIP